MRRAYISLCVYVCFRIHIGKVYLYMSVYAYIYIYRVGLLNPCCRAPNSRLLPAPRVYAGVGAACQGPLAETAGHPGDLEDYSTVSTN